MIAFALAVMLAFGMTACGDNTSSGTQSASSASAPGASPLIPDGPAPEINLITGEALAEGLAAGDRPVAVMVNNAQAALPQRGIGSADAVFEMVTEGGITRLLALYADKDTVPQVGPVRSARDQHLQCAMPLNSVIVHIGTSIYAENLLNQYQYSTINGMYLGSTSFVFDEARSAAGYANEHCWYTDAALIAAGMEKLGLSGTGASQALFDFVAHDAQPVVPAQGDAADVAFSFSDSGAVTLTYDAAAAKYLKTAYGAPQVDESTGAQLAFDNVLVLFTDIKLKNPDDPNNLVTDFAMSSGTGYYCYGGKFRAVTWEKGNPEDPLRLKDENGAALQVNVGKSYVAIVGKDREGTLLFGGVSPTGVIGGEGASSDAQSGAAASGNSDSAVSGTEVGLSANYKYAEFSKINSGKAILYKSTAASRKNKTVCVNAGHGTKGGSSVKTLCHPDGTPKVTGGTTGAGATTAVAVSGGMTFADGTAESKVTLQMAKILKDRLLAEGYDVLMIRESDDVQLDNIARTVIANNNADCHIALHWDSTSSNKGCFYMSVPNNASYRAMEPVASNWQQHNKLGDSLITGLKNAGNKIFSGGSMEMDLTQTSFSTIPSIDIELGDKASSHSTETLNQLGDGLTAGINAFFGF